jgi:hypothetical protein
VASDLWEVRSTIADGIVRLAVHGSGAADGAAARLVKKDQKTPLGELKTAQARLRQLRE